MRDVNIVISSPLLYNHKKDLFLFLFLWMTFKLGVIKKRIYANPWVIWHFARIASRNKLQSTKYLKAALASLLSQIWYLNKYWKLEWNKNVFQQCCSKYNAVTPGSHKMFDKSVWQKVCLEEIHLINLLLVSWNPWNRPKIEISIQEFYSKCS